ncbi:MULTISPECIES: N-acetylmuramoyl-L-alanine amidase [Deefgea]|uniref:N-acetylmuramoyl-L-alanine amidase n=1 Tax=Deefgea chitinilytica TaxID=570276 RepID=A0ABS2C9T8_9NEIS|nr:MULTISPECIES: N-acetylmuramoyl-L-alanine amidase [Deefgea]MBM5570915.1 AMIN domain-containing protein [Deefgea chitinilytica]MBM9888144.1 N-acetylmuramoyl-L-alanine amidase [Deefgea sp. CFH1-16]
MPERFDLSSELNPAFPLKRRDVLRAAAATLLLSVSPVSLAAAASIVAVRVWPAEAYTRVTIESSEPLTFNQFLIKDPERLVVDLNGIDLNNELQSLASKVGSDDPYIKLLRAGRNKPGTVRLVLDLKTQVSPQVFTLEPFGEYKHRLVIDLYPTVQNDPLLALLNETAKPSVSNQVANKPTESKASESKIDQAKPIEPKPAETASVDRSKLKVDRLITVVLDPGHGGEDPGAVGPSGTHEKTVVLQIAKRLKDLLSDDPNVRVVLTRDGDYFVPLGVRVKKARAVNADLFVSIHADAFVRADANGSSVFALSEGGATSAHARWLAQTQNNADLIGGIKLKSSDPYLAKTLMDLTTTATINDSLKLGKAMLGEISGINRLHKPNVEQASFAVLKAPDIPSILVETAFISNPAEEQKLISEDYQQKMALALHKGIKRYFAKNPPLARTRIAQN